MKLNELLKGNVVFHNRVDRWEDAIYLVGKPLIEQDIIAPKYLNAVIENVHSNGTYMVLFDYFSIPHAHPESGSLKLGVSFLKLNTPILFVDKLVKYFLLLSTGSQEQHIELLKSLGQILDDEDKILEQLEQANSEDDILNIFKGE